jgi:hypothetical protein
MGSIITKNSYQEAKYHNILKKDIIAFLSNINNNNILDEKKAIITQTEILLARASNYVVEDLELDDEKKPPCYEHINKDKEMTDDEFREYIKKNSFYFQYFLEIK